MLYRLRNRSGGILLWYSAALGQVAAVNEVVQSRNFTYESATSVSGGVSSSIISLETFQPTSTNAPYLITSTPQLSNTLPWSLTLGPDWTSTSSSGSTFIPSSSDVQWGPLTPPAPKAPSDATTSPLIDTTKPTSTSLTLDPASTTSDFAPSSTFYSNSTSVWSNTTTSSTSSDLPPGITSDPCEGRKRGCNTNTDTSKTEIPDFSITCTQGQKGCDHNTNTEKTEEPSITDSPIYPTKPSTCDITLKDGEQPTTFILVPNAETITLTVTANQSTSFSTIPEFTPPVYCSSTTNLLSFLIPVGSTRTSGGATFVGSSSSIGFGAAPTAAPGTTAYITSKNPVTVFTTETPPLYPGGPKTNIKQTVTPTSSDVHWGPLIPPPPKTPTPTDTRRQTPQTQIDSQPTPTPITTTIKNVPVVVGPSQVIIGGSTVKAGTSTKITQGGQTFTVNPSQIIGPGAIIAIPTIKGGIFVPTPTPTVIAGVPVQLGPSNAVIGGTTFAIGPGAPQTTIVAGGQTISVGPDGLGFAQTTVAPPVPTKIVIVDGEVISAVGSSIAVIGESTFFYGPSLAPQTDVFNGESIIIGPGGIVLGTTTMGGLANPSGTQIGLAGAISVTEIGASIAVIEGTTFTIGPDATLTTAVVDGKTITAGPDGLGAGGTTLSYPFNGLGGITATQVVTAGGITFSEIGSTLVDIGGTTFTIMPGSGTTDVYNGQTISLGPGGIGFKTTTFTASSEPTPTTSAKQTGKKNGSCALKPFHGVLGICIAIGVGYNS